MGLESIPLGLCQCGCGGATTLATEWRIRGQVLRYIHGHNNRGQRASLETRAKLREAVRQRGPITEETRERQRAAARRRTDRSHLFERWTRSRAGTVPHPRWKGGRRLSAEGYVMVYVGGTPLYVFEHVLVVERALGHPLPLGAVIHHVNGNKTDNRGANLVICPDDAYHVELHRKLRVLKAGGDPHRDRLCCQCKLAKPADVFSRKRTGGDYSSVCAACARARSATHRTKYPEHLTAQVAVRNALKNGTLVRPLRCESCGGAGRIYGHHPDYSQSLSVMWLCASCHTKAHRGSL
jgi:hypothetical protein